MLDLDAIQVLADDGIELCRRTDVDVSYTVPDQDVAALVAELRAARDFRNAVWHALRVGRIRGFDAGNLGSKDDCIKDVGVALAAYDEKVAGGVDR